MLSLNDISFVILRAAKYPGRRPWRNITATRRASYMAKKSDFGYLPYIGPEGFVFLRAHLGDAGLACALADELVKRGVRVFCDISGGKGGALPEEVAAGIQNCEAAFFVLTKDACESLDFRNSINYALKEKKRVVCVRPADFVPGYGLDMQLANVPSLPPGDAGETAAALEADGYLPDSVKGPGLVARPEPGSRRKLSLAVLAAAGVLLIAGALIARDRVEYLNSAEYQLRNVDGVEYLDISMYDDSALSLLDGKTIGTLYMENMGAKDISAISEVNVTNVDLAHNPDIETLEPVTGAGGIESVTVSQDMLDRAKPLVDAGLEVKVVR